MRRASYISLSNHSQRSRLLTLGIALISAFGFGCKQKAELKVNGKSAQENIDKLKPADEEIKDVVKEETKTEVEGKLVSERTHVQTRSVFNLTVARDSIDLGDDVVITNETTTSTLIEIKTVTEAQFSLGTGDLVIPMSLADPAMAGKFAYGDNNLRVTVKGAGGETYSERLITVRDFPWQGVGTASFVDAAAGQRQRGFQGRVVTGVTGATVTNGSLVLTRGSIGVLNQ